MDFKLFYFLEHLGVHLLVQEHCEVPVGLGEEEATLGGMDGRQAWTTSYYARLTAQWGYGFRCPVFPGMNSILVASPRTTLSWVQLVGTCSEAKHFRTSRLQGCTDLLLSIRLASLVGYTISPSLHLNTARWDGCDILSKATCC